MLGRAGGSDLSDTHVKDRRLHPRLVTTLAAQGTPEEGGVVARLTARNLSLGGLYCSSSVDFPEMTRLAVRLLLPLDGATEAVPLDVEAVVVRREETPAASGNGRYELGLYFTKLDATAREHLKRYLGHG